MLPDKKNHTDPTDSVPLSMRVVGMPELHAAIDAGQVYGEIRFPPLGPGVSPIELAPDEEIVARGPMLVFEDTDGTDVILVVPSSPLRNGSSNEVEMVLVAKRAALRRLKLAADDPRIADLARVLARGGDS